MRLIGVMVELGITAIGHDGDGGGFTVHFASAASGERAPASLAEYEDRLEAAVGGQGVQGYSAHQSEFLALYSPPGSPMVRISDEVRRPTTFPES
ncbi:hypothetical protein ABIB25_001225 [Nakamurella sp. UYEF19]|uniref:hypothetical protein n=1 Tax=Nakamurella sp. UYEF19 TaxID=1756392 RepID=UPI0033990C30